MDLTDYNAEIENYGQFLDLERPKNIKKFKILCHCPKCGKTHIRTYADLNKEKNFIYCHSHRRAILYEQRYGPGITCNSLRPDVQAKMKATKEAHFGKDWGKKYI